MDKLANPHKIQKNKKIHGSVQLLCTFSIDFPDVAYRDSQKGASFERITLHLSSGV